MPVTYYHRTLARTGVAGLAAALLVGGLAACGSAAAPPATSAAATTSAPSTQSTPAPSTNAAPAVAALVEQVVLSDADVADGYSVQLIDGGDQVTNQVTLDYCARHFASEAHRVVRRQVVLLDTTGASAGISNEVVGYDTPAHAAAALAELRAAVKSCPKHVFVKPVVAGQPAQRYDVSTLSSNGRLPAVANAVATSTVSAKGESGQYFSVEIFQVHGAVLDAVYVTAKGKPASGELAAATELAVITGQRLVGNAGV